MAGQMERGDCVYLIDGGRREGSRGKGEEGAVAVGLGVNMLNTSCQNHRHICCSSRMFPISFKCFLQPCESAMSCQDRRRTVFDILRERVKEIGWSLTFFFFLTFFFLFFRHFYKLPKLEEKCREVLRRGNTSRQAHIHAGKKSK